MDKSTQEWFNTENSPKQVLDDDFFTFLRNRAIGNADDTPNPTSHGLTAFSNLADAQPFVNPPSSSSAIGGAEATSLMNSDSWQKLGVAPNLFLRPRFSPQTPPHTTTLPCPNTNPQSTDEVSMVIDEMELSSLPEPPQPDLPSENTSHHMDIDDTDLPPIYQPRYPAPFQSTSAPMEVYPEEPLSSDLPHPAPIRVENNDEEAFSEEGKQEQYIGAAWKTLAETLNGANNMNASGSNQVTRRKGPKSRMAKKKDTPRIEAVQRDKKEVIDLGLEEVSI
jgi:hypothetical protein